MNASSAGSGLRPVVGITAEGRDGKGNIILPSEYTDAVVRAGGLPVLLPPWGNDAPALLARVDGVILAGGSDISPALYGGLDHPAVYDVDVERDTFEIALARLAAQRRVPMLGICRGLQIINVVLGGTLHEHLPDVLGDQVAHRGEPPAYREHRVVAVAHSRLAALWGVAECAPLSWHHQAIRSVAPSLIVEAQAEDGCIEAVTLPSHPFFVAVQWHPEMTAATDPAQQRLFDGLVRAAELFQQDKRQAGVAGSTY